MTHGRGYELELADGDVDAVRFERLLDESHPREALALWHGDALADLADEPFAAPEIRRLDELRCAPRDAIDADLEAGRHVEVIGELDALVAEQPLRERLHAQRMLALYRSAGSRRHSRPTVQARSALVEEIGVEPGAELRGCTTRSSPRIRRSTCPCRAEPRGTRRRRAGASRHLLVGAAVLLWRGRDDVRRHPGARAGGLAGHRREPRRAHRP